MFKLIIALAVLKLVKAQTCDFAISDLPKNEPVYLEKQTNGSFKLLQPVNNVTVLPNKKEITLLCPVTGNFFVDGKYNITFLLNF